MLEIKGYITNLGKYNEGELVGKWITFPVEEDELNEILQEIGCCYFDDDGEYINTGYEEYFFTDWDCGFDNNFGEYVSIQYMNELVETLEDWDADLFEAACEIWSMDEVLKNNPNDYMLLSHVKDDYDLGYYWIEESGCYNTEALGNLSNYIDYAGFGRDVSFESNGGHTSLGYIEYMG